MRSLFPALVYLVTAIGFAQDKTFTFNQTQIRISEAQWESQAEESERTVLFSNNKIGLQFRDEIFDLSIVSIRLLPENGAIYLCKDQFQKDITVMLITDQKMYVYNDRKRYLIDLCFQDPSPKYSISK
ncbi:MAG: hypothetical protein IR153_09385 [Flavobacterium sp.]|nr:hypothetical protein [Flavobacterium sp.]